jgi:hypothetical protein
MRASGLAEHFDLIEQVLPSLIARPVGFAADSESPGMQGQPRHNMPTPANMD